MPTYRICCDNSAPRHRNKPAILEVEGRKFKVTVAGAEFWFFVHEAHDRTNQLVISDLRSGKRVTLINVLELHACRGDRVQAAKRTWAKFLAERDPAKVRAVLEAAPVLPPVTKSEPIKEKH